MILDCLPINKAGQPDGCLYLFYCPGCKDTHTIPVGRQQGPNWTFDGNRDKPTFSPSLLIFTTAPETKQRRTICHLFVKQGRIEYCGDSPHELAGKTVDMVEIPEDMRWNQNDKA